MNSIKRRTRDWLRKATRRPFYEVVEEAMLTPEQVKFLTMKYGGGLRYKEIAAQCDIDESTVKRTINDAYHKVYYVLQEKEYIETDIVEAV